MTIDSSPTIAALVAGAAERFGDSLAVSDDDIELTYSGLFAESRSFAAALVASGVEPGDRVAIWAFNSAEWIISCLGLLQVGAVLVPVNTRFKGSEAAEVMARSGARFLVTVNDFLGTDYVAMLRGAGRELPALERIVIARGPVPDGTEGWGTFLERADAVATKEVDRRRAAVTTDDVSDILFTSGTTGVPKGVVMTHGRTLVCSSDWVVMTGLTHGDRYLQINPYFSQFGYKSGILASITAGAAMLPEKTFDVYRVLARVQRERVTILPGPPTVYQSILDHPDLAGFDLTSLRVAVTGSADTPVELIRRMYDELPFSVIISGYGMTEGGTAASTEPGDDPAAVATTVGRSRPRYEIRLVDGRGHSVPQGETGEIFFRGPGVMLHYLDNPEGTAATLSPEGWLRSGDLGRFDPDERLHIVGRIKDMYIVGGFNVYPAEVENALLRYPDIARAAVVGSPDHRLGQVGVAFVVLRPESKVTEPDEIIAWCRQEMANFKVPRVVEIVSTLPLNAAGKVEKEVLRGRAAAHTANA
jgi:HIP---CoA ligase